MTTTLKLSPIIQLTDEQFYHLCQFNRDLRLERNAKGELIVNPPTGGETGNYNIGLAAQIWNWNERAKLGKAFDSSTGFKLSNGATRSPDVAWVRLDRWESLSHEQQRRFPPLAPDFVIELMSPSDELTDIQEKMKEYIECGVRLGWLINRKDANVEIYRLDQSTPVVKMPVKLSGEDVLPGFELEI
ncbi:MAG: Uma2 family endonuclease [Lyngbya sp.]|nr:Uma2 family endonuclease [Lyngbya sp.]